MMSTYRGIAARLALVPVAMAAAVLIAWRAVPAPLPPVRIVKPASCGCCARWADYMKQQGFSVTVENRDDLTGLKRQNGITPLLESCHTAFVGGYVIEGHVPADLVKKLLADRPAGIRGLAAPGMPPSSPGMDTPGQHYTVYSFDARGRTRVYAVR